MKNQYTSYSLRRQKNVKAIQHLIFGGHTWACDDQSIEKLDWHSRKYGKHHMGSM